MQDYYGNETGIENSPFNLTILGHIICTCFKLRYKTNCDSEPVIPHYITGVGRKYIFHIGFVAAPLRQYETYFLPTSSESQLVYIIKVFITSIPDLKKKTIFRFLVI